MRKTSGYALKGLAFLLAPFLFGMLVATVQGWDALSGNARLLAGWFVLLLFSVVFPLFLARAGRAVMGHERASADRRAWRTGIAALCVAAVAVFLVPWRDLADWLASTLSELTGMPIVSPGRTR